MIGHQRELLTALGIDIWIPRAASCLEQPIQYLWRDQCADEMISAVPQLIQEPVQSTAPAQKVVVDIVQPNTAEAAVKNTNMVTSTPQPIAQITSNESQQIAAFSLQSLSLAHCLILVDVSELTTDQQQLWNNIQRAVDADFAELNWPFAWPFVQDGRGASSYVAGFIDAQASDKHLLQLGPIPYYQAANAIQLASLEEMLAQPLLKRRLWQLLQNKAQI